ncbi:MAG: DUF86 domain-containing protein [Methanomicrobium sp.]|nr:DUF86 domain-containing protein [Methanomicrobium sp.]
MDEMLFLEKYSNNVSFDELKIDEVLKRSFLRSIEIIGEASKNIPSSFKDGHPEISWKDMAGMRDRLIHAYFSVDWDIVWDVVKKEIPKNKDLIQKLIDEL